jgi:ankyrin repeat protein
LLGFWTAGAYSNGDMAVNYVGLIFYRNLTEAQMLKGQTRPPMLVRDGPYWKIAPHVTPTSDFLWWFVSDHLDESMNPSLYLPGMRDRMRQMASAHSAGILEHRRDRWGNRRSQAWFAQQGRDLRTYWGVDYGHAGSDAELIHIDKVCFAAPSNPRARDSRGRAPLHRAVAVADINEVRRLLDSGADVNVPVRSTEPFNSNWGDTPLHMAAQDGRGDIARLLLSRGADFNRGNDRGNTPLHRAVEYPELMATLIEAGADVNRPDARGQTPLHWAALRPDATSATLLLARGADPNSADHDGQIPLHFAARTGADVVNALVGQGSDTNAGDRLGARPLHVAAAARHYPAADALLRAGAQANATDSFGCTPLYDAKRQGAVALASLLRSAGPGEPVTAGHRQAPTARLRHPSQQAETSAR